MTAAAWRASRIILVGQAPGPTGPPPGRPLVGGRSGKRLQDLAGCPTLKDYLRRFETMNLLDRYPGRAKNAKGDRFDPKLGKMAAVLKLPKLRSRMVVFVGFAVAEAFGWRAPIAPFEWRYFAGFDLRDSFKAAVIPHVSGVVRFWNDPENVDRARIFFANLKELQDQGGGFFRR